MENLIQHKTSDSLTKQEKQYLSILGSFLVFALFYFIGNKNIFAEHQVVVELNNFSEREVASQMVSNRFFEETFDKVETKANSILVYNLNDDSVIYEKNVDEVMPLASLTKIMTAIIAMENLSTGEIVVIPKEALGLPGDNGLYADEKWTRDDLLKFMLITSSNDAARAVAMHVGELLPNDEAEPRDSIDNFVFYMNRKMNDLGFSRTYFVNETGLDISTEENGGYGTAREIAQLFGYAVTEYPEIFDSTSFGSQNFKSLDNLDHTALNTNQSLGEVAGISASKTGFTNISGGNLVVSLDVKKEKPIILVVLGSTFNDRFTDINKLANVTMEAIKILES